jgi:hypothetical protein
MSINPARVTTAAGDRFPALPSLNQSAGPEIMTAVPDLRVASGLTVPDAWFRRPGQRYAGEVLAA